MLVPGTHLKYDKAVFLALHNWSRLSDAAVLVIEHVKLLALADGCGVPTLADF